MPFPGTRRGQSPCGAHPLGSASRRSDIPSRQWRSCARRRWIRRAGSSAFTGLSFASLASHLPLPPVLLAACHMRTIVTPLTASHADTLAQPNGSRASHPSTAAAETTTHGRLFRATRSTSQARSVFGLSSASSAAVAAVVAAPASLRGSGESWIAPMISSPSNVGGVRTTPDDFRLRASWASALPPPRCTSDAEHAGR